MYSDTKSWNAFEKICMCKDNMDEKKIKYHLPGLFEFYELYDMYLPLTKEHPEYFYEWCEIGSIYGAPADCIWGGGRVGFGDAEPEKVKELTEKYGISSRLTFSNSLLTKEHLSDKKCNEICRIFESKDKVQNGIIIHSDLLKEYIKANYPEYYLISSTTKVITEYPEFVKELDKEDFSFVVMDFRLNKELDKLKKLSDGQKDKTEFLCNECCDMGCTERKKCYETVSRKSLGEDCEEHICKSSDGNQGYSFARAQKNLGFIGTDEICNVYRPMGFTNFKLEGRGLGSAMVFEILLYYMVKPEYRINVREKIYLDCMLDLF